MVQRRNRATGEAFLGCPRFPACRGTRPLEASVGGPPVEARTWRPRRPARDAGWAEVGVSFLERRLLRPLTPGEALLTYVGAAFSV